MSVNIAGDLDCRETRVMAENEMRTFVTNCKQMQRMRSSETWDVAIAQECTSQMQKSMWHHICIPVAMRAKKTRG